MARRLTRIVCSAIMMLAGVGYGAGAGRFPVCDSAPQSASRATEAAGQATTPVPADELIKTRHLWDARVTIADTIVLGNSKHGTRRIVPITGGTFQGRNIRGDVVPGGEDWQLIRPDGDIELYARYLLKTHDGFLIQVINRVLIHVPPQAEKRDPYIRSVVDLEAPIGSPYEYLNHSVFLGTLTQPTLKPGEKPYVIIGVYEVLG